MITPELDALRDLGRREGGRAYLGTTQEGGLALAGHQQAVLVLGPPRSGKTTSLIVPNVIAAPGAVLSTSTKPDVLAATCRPRGAVGRCWLFDPTGTVTPSAGVSVIRWSPVCAAARWDDSLIAARAMVGAARPRARAGDAAHWTERAEALLAPLFHAAAVSDGDMRVVVRWVLRQELSPAQAALSASGSEVAADVLAGMEATDEREQSGIWSTVAGVLAAYRSEAALASASDPNFDPAALPATGDTVYLCAPSRHQDLVAPIVVAFVEQARGGAYAAAGRGTAPLTFVLDELANIAPLPGLPSLVAEGGGQGAVTVAALQDLSQARERWGPLADGFLSLFGAKVVLPGIGDMATLELVSRLAGDTDIATRSVTRGSWWSPSAGAPTTTWSTRRQRRLPVDAVNQQPPGSAVVLCGSQAPERVWLPAWWEAPVFSAVARASVERTARQPPSLSR